MPKLDSSITKIEQFIKEKTNNDPDVIYKRISFFNYNLCIIFRESATSRDIINDFILEFLEERQFRSGKNIKNIFNFLESNVPENKVVQIDNYEDFFYNLSSGFTTIFIDGEKKALSYESRTNLNSNISTAQNEKVIKGPKDAFTENYQINIGMIRKRIKSENLWIEELKVGKLSQTKVGILYINGITSKELVDMVKDKISKINIDAVLDSNYIIETITGNYKNAFPTVIYTERPDHATSQLLEGKLAIVVENSQLVVILPALFVELFHSMEDNYQKPINANYTRIIRLMAFLITVLTPAIYVAITTYNHEAIPSSLLINFSIQRDGVPFPTIMEAILMLITFEILKETDTRIPVAIGSSLSIVGALVLGDAAVTAGIVSPIMVIVIAITAISGLILSYLDAINGIRWWRLLFLIFASIFGIVGIVIAGFIFIVNLTSIKSLGIPYLTPIAPTIRKDLGGSIFITNKSRFFKRRSYNSKNITKGRDYSI